MGIVSPGIPKDIVIELAKLSGAEVFIETGTLHGDTTRWASHYFTDVHTVEMSEELYNENKNTLSTLSGVTTHLGNSRNVLPVILSKIQDKTALLWLDGHWSGGDTAGVNDECPLLEELENLKGRPNDIILIDDARLFLSAPPLPHDPLQWPNITEIIESVESCDGERFIQIVNDVIFIIPNEPEIKNCLIEYSQTHANDLTKMIKRLRSPIKSLINNLFSISKK